MLRSGRAQGEFEVQLVRVTLAVPEPPIQVCLAGFQCMFHVAFTHALQKAALCSHPVLK